MGRRGPPPKPTKLKKLAGNPGKRKLPKQEPKPPATDPDRPAWISPAAVVEWDRITPILKDMGLLSAADQVALGAYCQAAAELQLATATIEADGRYIREPLLDKKGSLILDKKGKPILAVRLKPHPALKYQRDAFARVKAFLQEFGLSPSARARLGNPAKDEASDELGAIILKMQGKAG